MSYRTYTGNTMIDADDGSHTFSPYYKGKTRDQDDDEDDDEDIPEPDYDDDLEEPDGNLGKKIPTSANRRRPLV